MKKLFKLFSILVVGLALVSCQQPNSDLPEDKLPLLSSIEITAQPTKTVYIVGEELDTTGLEVTATYSDESTKDVTAEATITGYDKEKTGEQTVEVSYTENEITQTAIFTVTVKEKTTEPGNKPGNEPGNEPPKVELTKIEITAQPTKTVYIVGEELDTTGLEVTAVYNDENKKTVNNWTTSGFDSSKAVTSQAVTISYTENEVTKTAEFNVEIKEKKLENPPKTEPPVTYTVKFEVVETEYWWTDESCHGIIYKISESEVADFAMEYMESHKPSFETKILKKNEEYVLENYSGWMFGNEKEPDSRIEVQYFADEELTSPIEPGSSIKNENKTIYVKFVYYLYKGSYRKW